ncbi:cytochrome P450 9e2-like [Venturia canescens]|uniref:cytochrome P450 9e2-like n=1 Tax=Venturia canescens TaxID=32260 RepID=UPI001C9D06C9|nr:cytochrome P450 9e2-like [Venturia canescens]
MVFWALVLGGVAVALAAYHYLVGVLKFFERRDVPHVEPRILVGNMGPVVMRQRSIAEQVKRIYDSHPEAKYVGFHDFTIPTIMLRDPEVIKFVTVKNFDNFVNHTALVDDRLDPFFGKNLFGLRDDSWRSMRSILSPSFTSSKIKGMFHLVSECGAKFANNLSSKSQEIELKDNFTRYTMDVIATAAFGITVDSIKNPTNEFYLMGRDATTFDYLRTMKLFMFKISPWLSRLFQMRIIPLRVVDFFLHIVSSTVKTREAEGKSRNDMIQLMMEARNSGKAPNLTMEDMTAQAFIFFFGGFETTSTAMSFAAHEVTVNPEVQDKLQAEIDDALNENNGLLTWEAFQGMRYLEAVVNETLRKYPPAVATDRICNKAIEIPAAVPGGKPFMAQPGSVFWLPYYGLHHDPKYFKNPEVFDPERFIDPTTGKIVEPLGFLPFGSGPRFCIGQRFALMEVKLAIFYLFSKNRLEPCSKTENPITLNRKNFTMTAENDFWVKISPRH